MNNTAISDDWINLNVKGEKVAVHSFSLYNLTGNPQTQIFFQATKPIEDEAITQMPQSEFLLYTCSVDYFESFVGQHFSPEENPNIQVLDNDN